MPLPHRFLSQALSVALALLGAGCADLTAPGTGAPPPAPVVAREPEPAPTPSAAPTPPPAPEEQVGTSHILIMYKGSMRAPETVTRSKEQARKLAGEVLAKAQKGQDFAALAKQYTDETGGKERGGALPKFGRSSGFVKPYKDAAFALKPGQVSDLVETDFGFHIIKRTE
jgi:hypothetical protein